MAEGRDMSPLVVRSKFLLDHAQLKGKAAVLHSLALSVMRGDADLLSTMRLKGEELQTHLLTHMQWEERRILPLLREAADDHSRVDVFLEEHHTQRQLLANSLISIRDHQLPSTELAKRLLDFVRWLEREMVAEELNVLEVLNERRAKNRTAS